MILIPEPFCFDMKARVWSRIKATNEWSLNNSTLPLTLVPKGNKVVPYSACFDITASQINSNQCKITVRTISSWVPDGKEIGIHGGWAEHAKHVSPLLLEETNVLSEIGNALAAIQGGKTNSLAPTPDTKTAMQYQLQQLREVNPNAEKDLREWLKAHGTTNDGVPVPVHHN